MSLLQSRTPAVVLGKEEGGRYKSVTSEKVSGFKWSEVDAESIFQTVAAVTSLGDSIMFGKTKEGDCGFLMVLSSGLADKWYPSTYQEAQTALDAIFSVASRPEPA